MELLRKRDNPQYKVGTLNMNEYFLYLKESLAWYCLLLILPPVHKKK